MVFGMILYKIFFLEACGSSSISVKNPRSFSADSQLIVCEKYPPSKIINVEVSISPAFNDFYLVVHTLHKPVGHAMDKAVGNLITPILEHGKPNSKFFETSLANKCLPVVKRSFCFSAT